MSKHQLGARLSTLRKSQGLTQAQVGAVLGVSEGSYRHYESGRSVPNALQLEQIANYFNVTTDYLLGRENEALSPERQELVNLAQALSNDKVAALLAVAKTIQ